MARCESLTRRAFVERTSARVWPAEAGRGGRAGEGMLSLAWLCRQRPLAALAALATWPAAHLPARLPACLARGGRGDDCPSASWCPSPRVGAVQVGSPVLEAWIRLHCPTCPDLETHRAPSADTPGVSRAFALIKIGCRALTHLVAGRTHAVVSLALRFALPQFRAPSLSIPRGLPLHLQS